MPLLGTIGLIAAGCRRSVFLTDRSCEPLRCARARRWQRRTIAPRL